MRNRKQLLFSALVSAAATLHAAASAFSPSQGQASADETRVCLLRALSEHPASFDYGMQAAERCITLDDPKNTTSRMTIATKYFEKAFKDASLSDLQKNQYADSGLGYAAIALAINPNLVDGLVLKALLLRVKAGATPDEKRRNAFLYEANLLQQDARELRQSGKGEFSGAAMPDVGAPTNGPPAVAPAPAAPPAAMPPAPPVTQGQVTPQQPTVLWDLYSVDTRTGALTPLEKIRTKTDGGLSSWYTYLQGGSSPATLSSPPVFASLSLQRPEGPLQESPFKLERLSVKDGRRYATKKYMSLDARTYGQPVPGLDKDRKSNGLAYPYLHTPREPLAPGEYALTFFGLADTEGHFGTTEKPGGAFRVAETQAPATGATMQAPPSGEQAFAPPPASPRTTEIAPGTLPASRDVALDLFHLVTCGFSLGPCWHPGRLAISPTAIRWTESEGNGKDNFAGSCDDLEASKPYAAPTRGGIKSKGAEYGFDTSLKIGGRDYSFWFRMDQRPDPPFDRVLAALRAACPGVKVKE